MYRCMHVLLADLLFHPLLDRHLLLKFEPFPYLLQSWVWSFETIWLSMSLSNAKNEFALAPSASFSFSLVSTSQLPSKANWLPQCSMSMATASWTATPPLPYVWGDANDMRTVFINGKSLDMTVTLDSALSHVRESKGELKVWSDGICINQSDVEERNI